MYCKKFHKDKPNSVFQCNAYPVDIPHDILGLERHCPYFDSVSPMFKHPLTHRRRANET
jgi:hypothetical protein